MELENIVANSLLLKARQVLCIPPLKHQLVQPFSGRPPRSSVQASVSDLMPPLLASQESWRHSLGPQVPVPATAVLHTPSLLQNC
uniref:G protein-coupled receptor kinase 4 n=1 Tax=Nomascus leucogenys TaxID=61853 RepID=A0A2I3GQG1_NOMLE